MSRRFSHDGSWGAPSRPATSYLIPAGWEVLPWVEKNLLKYAHLLRQSADPAEVAEASELEECARRLHDLWQDFDGRVPKVRADVSGRLAAFRLHTVELDLTHIVDLPGAIG